MAQPSNEQEKHALHSLSYAKATEGFSMNATSFGWQAIDYVLHLYFRKFERYLKSGSGHALTKNILDFNFARSVAKKEGWCPP